MSKLKPVDREALEEKMSYSRSKNDSSYVYEFVLADRQAHTQSIVEVLEGMVISKGEALEMSKKAPVDFDDWKSYNQALQDAITRIQT